MPYDRVNNVRAPEIDGFAGGIFYGDNSTEYVGYGNFRQSNCVSGGPAPAYILTNPSKPGGYLQCSILDDYEKDEIFYILKNPDLKWIPTDIDNIHKLAGLINVPGAVFPTFWFGRVKYEGIYYLGKYYLPDERFYITTSEGYKGFKTGFEVLACSSAEQISSNNCGNLSSISN